MSSATDASTVIDIAGNLANIGTATVPLLGSLKHLLPSSTLKKGDEHQANTLAMINDHCEILETREYQHLHNKWDELSKERDVIREKPFTFNICQRSQEAYAWKHSAKKLNIRATTSSQQARSKEIRDRMRDKSRDAPQEDSPSSGDGTSTAAEDVCASNREDESSSSETAATTRYHTPRCSFSDSTDSQLSDPFRDEQPAYPLQTLRESTDESADNNTQAHSNDD